MPEKAIKGGVALVAAAMLAGMAAGAAWAVPGQIQQNCKQCHQAGENTLWGMIKPGSQGKSSFAMQIGNQTWNLQYDKNSRLKKMRSVVQLRDNEAVMARIKPTGDHQGYVEEFRYKPNLSFLKPGMVIEIDDLANLMKQDPRKANYVIFDVRGYGDYIDGHLPGAVSLPYYRMNAFMDRLPKDKNTHIITYCNSYG